MINILDGSKSQPLKEAVIVDIRELLGCKSKCWNQRWNSCGKMQNVSVMSTLTIFMGSSVYRICKVMENGGYKI